MNATVELIAARRGGDADEWRQLFGNALHDDERHFVVALIDGRVIGFGHTKLVERADDGGDGDVPPLGWYLAGVTVHPDYRRRGVGTEPTRVRLDRPRGVTEVVCYAADPDDVATLELHALLGFSPTGRWVNVAGAERALLLHCLVM